MNYKYGDTFTLKGTKYVVIGTDPTKNQIECQTIPFDEEYYWFQVVGDGLGLLR